MRTNQVMMEELDIIRRGDLGLKDFEILFQKNVEDAVVKNGLPFTCWWNVLDHEEIFLTLMNIYSMGDSDDHSLLFNIEKYYNSLKERTDLWIKERLV